MLNYLDGYDRKEVTLRAEENIAKGMPVSMSSDYTVKASETDDSFAGICIHSDSGSAAVLLKGFVKVPYTGTAPVHGFNKLAANGNGGVKTATDGREALVVSVDTTASVCGIIL